MTKTSFPVSRLWAGLGLAFALLGAGVAHAADTTRVIVSFKPGSQAAQLARAAIAKAGGKIKLEILGGGAVAVERIRTAAG